MDKHGSVLIAEDEKLFNRSYTDLVHEFRPGYVIHSTVNGIETIDCIRSRKIELLIMGLKMPRIDGFGVMEYLLERRMMIPTVIVTAMWYCFHDVFVSDARSISGLMDRDDREHAILRRYRHLVFGYLPVPVKKEEFREAILRCEEFQRHCAGGQSVDVWNGFRRFGG